MRAMLRRLVFLVWLAAGVIAPVKATQDGDRFIVEYAKHVRRHEAQAFASTVSVVASWENEVFRGAAVDSASHTLESLQALPEVERAWYNREIPLENAGLTRYYADDSVYLNYSTHRATGVEALHQQGILGQGALVGIIDTGIDYTHDALGGGIGAGFKVAGGYDFVGDGDWPKGPKQPSTDPRDRSGHGTHVAGIVAGNSTLFKGVAPEATIYAYKVLANQGCTDDATLVDAFMRAYEDGMDVISASIGGTGGWADNPVAVIASRLVDLDVVVTIAQGNKGFAGPFHGGTGSEGKNVIAVGSVNAASGAMSSFKATFWELDGSRKTVDIGYLPGNGYWGGPRGWPIVPMTLDSKVTDDACTPYPPGTANLTGVIPLVRRGTCSPDVKKNNLLALGAAYVLMYNDGREMGQPYTTDFDNYIASISSDDGEDIVQAVAAGLEVTADFSDGYVPFVSWPRTKGNYPSDFTSWGGSNDLGFKPDISAPGGDIFSTWPDNLYGTSSGTSMATPYVAGVAALYIGKHGGREKYGPGFARMLSRRIISSGEGVPWFDGLADDMFAPTAQLGAGLVNAVKVVGSTTTLDFDPVALNDTANFAATHRIKVRNGADGPVTYNFSLVAHAGVNIHHELDSSGFSPRIKALEELSPAKMVATASLPDPLTLQPGESQEVSVTFDRPTFGAARNLPLYGGKILISRGDSDEVLGVPYMGLAADLKAEMADMFMRDTPRATHFWTLETLDDRPALNFSLWRDVDFLLLEPQLKWATRELRFDVFGPGYDERRWSWPPVVGVNGYVGSAAYYALSSATSWNPYANPDPMDVIPFPVRNVYRNAVTTDYRYSYMWQGVLANGSQIERGSYKMRFAALKPFGDPNKSEDWSVYVRPFEVLGKFGPRPY
ncbi:hypothetical protein MCOR27_005326 [Pyricularia oryzae]|uniref:Minor extracellular protease vpr n=2 Tax=Pyricularia TaxID=48558 RepID=A0ABQ8NFV8_PYRGI|nr:hypothetical protein MCOR01_003884 [Pyricularia oryzae]KAI6296392.1 hypothetical protein MCOR33_007004 [Pyricularia grisea]KAH9427410.1 hypothetical protein MCOR02_012314 [Pyricularia oryzae]KAI6256159.1 hypothetical protein MCOR19_007383 [Pyricularia oryzae]KAI6272239.1 hypothetical protein MCOR26_007461 [Pyricularia oryzae]